MALTSTSSGRHALPAHRAAQAGADRVTTSGSHAIIRHPGRRARRRVSPLQLELAARSATVVLAVAAAAWCLWVALYQARMGAALPGGSTSLLATGLVVGIGVYQAHAIWYLLRHNDQEQEAS